MSKRKELPGSYRQAPFEAVRKSYPPDELIEISLLLQHSKASREHVAKLDLESQELKKYLLKQHEPSDGESDSIFCPEEKDCEIVEGIAREYNLQAIHGWPGAAEWHLLDKQNRLGKMQMKAQQEPEGHLVRLRGVVGDVQELFQTDLNLHESPPSTYRWREGSLYPPEDLAEVIEGAFGLDTREIMKPLAAGTAAREKQPARTWFDQICRHSYLPEGCGRGERVGIIEFGGGIHRGTLEKYFSHRGAKFSKPHIVHIHGKNDPHTNFRDDEEVALDIEVVSAIAPDAETILYFAPNNSKGVIDALHYATHSRYHPHILCLAWGNTEERWQGMWLHCVNRILHEAACRGITVCAASGDDGVALDKYGYRRVYFPASSPFVLACGGTAFIDRKEADQEKTGQKKKKIDDKKAVESKEPAVWNQDEIVWNEDGLYASGGGESHYIKKPDWQTVPPKTFPAKTIPHSVQARIVSAKEEQDKSGRQNPHSEPCPYGSLGSCPNRCVSECLWGYHVHPGRYLPDVAALANRIYSVYADGAYVNATGGTSASAAVWAGLVARLNEGLRKAGIRRVGYLTPLLYLDPGLQKAFNDITCGENDPEHIRGYAAVPGWDACTGWGSPKGKKLLDALINLYPPKKKTP